MTSDANGLAARLLDLAADWNDDDYPSQLLVRAAETIANRDLGEIARTLRNQSGG